MTFLPIVERELRVAARRRSTYWGRAVSAFLAILIVGWFLLILRNQSSAILSKTVFATLSMLAYFYCFMVGVRTTADCLSEEKREGTLGLLFLTDLKGYDVVLGKLAATSLHGVYSLLAIFPILAIPLLLGGVTAGELWRTIFVLTNTMFLSLAVGLLVSAHSHQARKAMAAAFLLMLLINAGVPLLGLILAASQNRFPVRPGFLAPSSGYAIGLAADLTYKTNPIHFWWSCSITHSLAWLFLGLSCLRVPKSWQDKPATILRLRWRERWKQWSYGDAEQRQRFRQRLLARNPICWLAGRDRLKLAYVWGFLGLSGVLWAWGAFKFRRDWWDEGTYFATAFFLNTAIKCWIASEASRRFIEDRQSGSLELLLSTPLLVGEILWGQMLALRRQFLGPLLAVLVVDGIFLLTPVWGFRLSADDLFWVLMFLAGMIMLLADGFTLGWVGMWMGLTTKHPNRATSSTIARILLLPWVLFLLILMALALSSTFSSLRIRFEPDERFFLAIWFILGILADLFFGFLSYVQLKNKLRLVATTRYGAGRRATPWPWFRSPPIAAAPPVTSS